MANSSSSVYVNRIGPGRQAAGDNITASRRGTISHNLLADTWVPVGRLLHNLVVFLRFACSLLISDAELSLRAVRRASVVASLQSICIYFICGPNKQQT